MLSQKQDPSGHHSGQVMTHPQQVTPIPPTHMFIRSNLAAYDEDDVTKHLVTTNHEEDAAKYLVITTNGGDTSKHLGTYGEGTSKHLEGTSKHLDTTPHMEDASKHLVINAYQEDASKHLGTTYEEDGSSYLAILGWIQICCGILCITFNFVIFAIAPYSTPCQPATAIWTGGVFILSGTLGVSASKHKTICMIGIFLVLAVCSTFLASILAMHSLVGWAISSGNAHVLAPLYYFTMFLSLVEIAVSIASSAVCCYVVCLRSSPSYDQQVVCTNLGIPVNMMYESQQTATFQDMKTSQLSSHYYEEDGLPVKSPTYHHSFHHNTDAVGLDQKT